MSDQSDAEWLRELAECMSAEGPLFFDKAAVSQRLAAVSEQHGKAMEALAYAEEKLGLISATGWGGHAKRHGDIAREALPIIQAVLQSQKRKDLTNE